MKIDQLRSRSLSRIVRRFFIDELVPCMDKGAHYMRAALENTKHTLGTAEFAEEFWEAEK